VYHRCKLFVAQGVVHAGPEGGGLGSGKWTTHFLVLEEAVDQVKESVEWQQRESGNGEKTAVAVKDF
jgi:hypothetical protein